MSKKTNSLAGLILVATGALVGVAATLLVKEFKPKHPSLVLEQVKQTFQENGSITGSWIDYDPIEYDLFDSLPLVYLGGISKQEGEEIVTFNFVADAYTGDIIDIFEYQA